MRIDDTLISKLGLGALGPTDRANFLRAFQADLERAVGNRLYRLMTDEAVTEFSLAYEREDHDRAYEIMRADVPDLSEVVRQEGDRLCALVGERVPEILAATAGAESA